MGGEVSRGAATSISAGQAGARPDKVQQSEPLLVILMSSNSRRLPKLASPIPWARRQWLAVLPLHLGGDLFPALLRHCGLRVSKSVDELPRKVSTNFRATFGRFVPREEVAEQLDLRGPLSSLYAARCKLRKRRGVAGF
jgi:hypothetical protein